MGGRAAEELIFGEAAVTTGAGDDIHRATKVARNMVTQWGMSEVIGPVTLAAGDEQHFLGRDIGLDRQYGEDTAALIDQEVHKILKFGYQKAKSLLSDHIDKLHALAKRLIEYETVDGEYLRALLQAGAPAG